MSNRNDTLSESTIARIAGNILSGGVEWVDEHTRAGVVRAAVATARAIAAEVKATAAASQEPTS
jgi:hypothetical protein